MVHGQNFLPVGTLQLLVGTYSIDTTTNKRGNLLGSLFAFPLKSFVGVRSPIRAASTTIGTGQVLGVLPRGWIQYAAGTTAVFTRVTHNKL